MAKPSLQQWLPESYGAQGRFVSDLGAQVLALLDPRPGERLLDLGCGDGALTAQLVERGARVIGVDASAAMVEGARARGLEARIIDGQALPFEAAFEAVFSNAALHWMLQPERVIAGVHRALVPGGRFVAEMGGHGNVAAIHGALEGALGARGMAAPRDTFFPTPEHYGDLLKAGGFQVESMALIPRPTPCRGRWVTGSPPSPTASWRLSRPRIDRHWWRKWWRPCGPSCSGPMASGGPTTCGCAFAPSAGK